jgi:hypothetical protein
MADKRQLRYFDDPLRSRASLNSQFALNLSQKRTELQQIAAARKRRARDSQRDRSRRAQNKRWKKAHPNYPIDHSCKSEAERAVVQLGEQVQAISSFRSELEDIAKARHVGSGNSRIAARDALNDLRNAELKLRDRTNEVHEEKRCTPSPPAVASSAASRAPSPPPRASTVHRADGGHRVRAAPPAPLAPLPGQPRLTPAEVKQLEEVKNDITFAPSAFSARHCIPEAYKNRFLARGSASRKAHDELIARFVKEYRDGTELGRAGLEEFSAVLLVSWVRHNFTLFGPEWSHNYVGWTFLKLRGNKYA